MSNGVIITIIICFTLIVLTYITHDGSGEK